jgi:hypothetical protein
MCLPSQQGMALHACVCVLYYANKTPTNDRRRRPPTTNHREPPPTPSQPPLPAPSSFIVLVRHWGLLPTTLRPYQACAKPGPRSADVLAHSGADGRLSAALIGCGGRLMRLGPCLGLMFAVSVVDVSPTHTTTRCAPCMCPPNKVLLLTMYPMCKSTANLLRIRRDRYVVALSASQFLSFDASLLRFHPPLVVPSSLSHPILPSDIPLCPGVYRRNHHGHPYLLPTLYLSSVSHAATVPLATRCCKLPLTNPSIPPLQYSPPPPFPSIQASLLSCSHPAPTIPRPYLPAYPTTDLPPRTSPSLSPPSSLLLQS